MSITSRWLSLVAAQGKADPPAPPRPQRRPEDCTHSQCIPAFDAISARGLDEYEVHCRPPRFCETCPDCGGRVVAYASAEHYIAGDW